MNSEDVLKCIDDVFDKIGGNAKKVIYYHLERYGLKRKDIVDNPIEFHKALCYLFGDYGDMLEKMIIEEFRRRFNVKVENGTLADYINRVRGMEIEKISSLEG